MGIKGSAEVEKSSQAGAGVAGETGGEGLAKRQEEIFRNLDKQYSVARSATHTQRGSGLGFGS